MRLLGVTAYGPVESTSEIHFRAGEFGGLRQLHGVAVERDVEGPLSYITHIWHLCESGGLVAHGQDLANCGSARYTLDSSGAFLQDPARTAAGRAAARALQRFCHLLRAPMYRPERSAAALATMLSMADAQHVFDAHQPLAVNAKALLEP